MSDENPPVDIGIAPERKRSHAERLEMAKTRFITEFIEFEIEAINVFARQYGVEPSELKAYLDE